MSRVAKGLALVLSALALPTPCHLGDESIQRTRRLHGGDIARRQFAGGELIDKVAAAYILQGLLDRLGKTDMPSSDAD